MPVGAQPGSAERRLAWLLDLLEPARASLLPLIGGLVFSYAFFVGAPAWNQNSRFALTRALVEERTTAIDSSHHTTGDKSFRDGHFYCDKAPGVSVFATVPYAGYTAIRTLLGGMPPTFAVQSLDPKVKELGTVLDPEDRLPGDRLGYSPSYRFALYLCTFVVVVLPTAVLGGGATFLLGRRLSGSARAATFAALTYGVGTPVWVYSTSLYGHALCGALLLAAFALLELAPARARAASMVAGTLLGAAVITEYPAAVVALLGVAYAWVRRGRADALRVCVGGLPWALLLAGYHWVAFGSPLSTGYDFVYRTEFAEGMAVNYGLGAPDPTVAVSLLFGSFRGLFYVSPICLLAVWGLARGVARAEHRALYIVASLVLAYFWLLNAGYYMWDGGAAAGPRHMVPALGFLALGIVHPWRVVPRGTAVVLGLSVVQSLLLAAARPQVAPHGDPQWECARGRLVEAVPSANTGHSNLGLLLGLPGVFSVLPLLLGWTWVWAWGWRGVGRGSDGASEPALKR